MTSYTYISTNSWTATATATTNTTAPSPTSSVSQQRDPVSVMYAASLIKTFEETLGPAFQADTGYPYVGEARGSVQVANMILDGLRRPDVFVSAGTIPIKKLMNATDPLADWLVKFGSAERAVCINIKCGINCGEVLVGLTDTNTRSQLTVVGSTVNLASRIESEAHEDQIMVSEEVKDKILGKYQINEVRIDNLIKSYPEIKVN